MGPNTPNNDHRSTGRGLWLFFGIWLLALILLSGWLAYPVQAQYPPPGPEFDFTISKSAVPSKFSFGSDNHYVISVYRTNNMPVGIPSISIEDHMPAGLTIDEIIAEDWTCSISVDKKNLNCTYTKSIPIDILSLPPVFVKVNVPKEINSPITNTVYLNIVDNNLNNNQASVSTIIDSVDLEIKKTQSKSAALVGEEVTYTLVVTNHGPAEAIGVEVKDKLSEYLSFIESQPSQGNYNDSSGIWEVGILSKDASETLTIKAEIKNTGEGKLIENIAEVTSENASDINPANNKSKTSLVVGGLEITKAIDKLEYKAYVGEPVTFLITVKNSSLVEKTNISFVDDFGDSLDVDIVRSNKLNQGVTLYPDQADPNIIKSSFKLGPKEEKLIKIVARPNNTITSSKKVTNTAKIIWSGLTIESNEVELTVDPAAAILITKTDGVTTILPDQYLVYKISISNIGSQLMGSGVEIYDYLDLHLEDATVIRGEDLPANTPITFNNSVIKVGPLNFPIYPDDEITFEIKARVNKNTPIGYFLKNTAKVFTPENYFNANLEDEAVDDDTKVGTIVSSDMSITLSLSPKQAKVGEDLNFRIDVKNTGNTQSDNVTVTGTMQPVLDYISSKLADGTSFTVNTTAHTYTWSIGALAPNQTRSMTMVWRVNNSVTASATYDHVANLTWNVNKGISSNKVTYRVTPSSTLPGTGFGPDRPPAEFGTGAIVALITALFGALGLTTLTFGVWSGKKKSPAKILSMLGYGAVLVGFILTASACSSQTATPEPPQQLSVISRETREPDRQAQPTDFVEVWDAWPTPTPHSLPDYPIPAPPDHLNQGVHGNEADSSPVNRIVIPAMGLDTVVKYVPFGNSTWLIGGLKQEIAWMGDTSWPGLGSNTGLAGHVDLVNGDNGPFWNLKDLKQGDSVTLFTERNQYTYLVRESTVVPDTNMDVIAPTEKPQLTLITCTGWDNALRLYLLRLVVSADLAEVKPLGAAALNH